MPAPRTPGARRGRARRRGLFRAVEPSFEDPLAERLEAVLAGDRDLVDVAVYEVDGHEADRRVEDAGRKHAARGSAGPRPLVRRRPADRSACRRRLTSRLALRRPSGPGDRNGRWSSRCTHRTQTTRATSGISSGRRPGARSQRRGLERARARDDPVAGSERASGRGAPLFDQRVAVALVFESRRLGESGSRFGHLTWPIGRARRSLDPRGPVPPTGLADPGVGPALRRKRLSGETVAASPIACVLASRAPQHTPATRRP
jgi:hypothetical protein